MKKRKGLSWIIFTVFILTAVLGSGLTQAVAGSSFSDIQGHWAASQVQKMADQGVVNGYPDGTFRPDASISRAEFVTMVNNAFKFTAVADLKFTDVKAVDWYASGFAKGVAAGYINGYEDGSIKPNNPISRQEAAAIIAKILKLSSSEDALKGFQDNSQIAGWSKAAVAALVSENLMKGYPDQTFKPANSITRAEAAALFATSISKYNESTLPAASLSAVSDQSVTVGLSKVVTLTSTPADAVKSAKSDTDSVAKVEVNGDKLTIKGVAKGTAKITVTASKTGYKDATTTFTANVTTSSGGGGGGGGTPAISLTPISSQSVVVGKSTTVGVTSSPTSATIAASSSNNNVVVAVSDHTLTLTGAAAGTATITVTAAYSGYNTGSTTFVVTVTSAGISFTKTVTEDPVLGTLVYVTIDSAYADKVTAVTVKTVAATKLPSGKWYAKLPANSTVNDSDIIISTEKAISFTKTVTEDPVLGTLVYVTIDSVYADKVTAVTVKTVAATKLASGKWYAKLPANSTVNDSDIIISTETAIFTKTVTEDPVLGTLVYVTIGSAYVDKVTAVTVKTVPATKLASGKWYAKLPANSTVSDSDITISTANVPVTAVSLNNSTLTLNQGSNATLVATIVPDNATNKNVSWTSSDTTIASVSGGTVAGLKSGSAIITVSTNDGGKTATCNVTVKAVTGNFINRAFSRIAMGSGIDVWVVLNEGLTPSSITANSDTMTFDSTKGWGAWFYHNDNWTAPTDAAPIVIKVIVNGVEQTQNITVAD